MDGKIAKFVSIPPWSGYGSGVGACTGYNYGNGNGSGAGLDTGKGNGRGAGFGSGVGYEDGVGSGAGAGSGYGDGDGVGCGVGDSDCGGVLRINSHSQIHVIDGVATIVHRVRGDIAMGCIVGADLTLTPCFIVRSEDYFAHGETIKKALGELERKKLANLNQDEIRAEFKRKFSSDKKYSGHDFFAWHGALTGSCLLGREHFVKSNGINLDEKFTVEEFVRLSIGHYGENAVLEAVEI